MEAALLVTLLDRTGLMPGVAWLEMHLDHWSVQATLLHGQSVSVVQQLRQTLAHTSRIEKG